MKKNMFIKTLSLAVATLLLPFALKAQPHKNSPHDTISGKVAGANIRIVYGSPAVKGRTIWGDLVPYDKAWRAGADEATTFATDKDIMVQGKKLPAGTYTLFIIPGKTEWKYIFNSQTGQWGIKRTGEANYEEAKNVLTVSAKPKPAAMQEHLTFVFYKTGFGLRWEKLEVPVTIK
ncbi:DUF2911 domain-containing protein [Mucilaginibacter koreensis]